MRTDRHLRRGREETTESPLTDRTGAAPRHPARVHICWTDLDVEDAFLRELATTLSADELSRAGRFVFERDRRRFVAGRAFLRAVLARQLGARAGELRFAYGAQGKPELAGGARALRFNLAHSAALAVCAVTRGHEVGVDVERLRPLPDAEPVARRFFSTRENEVLAALPEARRQRGFYDAWTRKEAFLKALGSGLARALDGFDVSLAPGEPARLLRTADDPAEAGRYSLRAFEPEAGYVGAVAVEAREVRLHASPWSWRPAWRRSPAPCGRDSDRPEEQTWA